MYFLQKVSLGVAFSQNGHSILHMATAVLVVTG